MSDSLAALHARKLRLERNGKNSEGQGVLRRINREIRKLKNEKQLQAILFLGWLFLFD